MDRTEKGALFLNFLLLELDSVLQGSFSGLIFVNFSLVSNFLATLLSLQLVGRVPQESAYLLLLFVLFLSMFPCGGHEFFSTKCLFLLQILFSGI